MQPCQVCGAVDIDVNGYCVNCRTFRGMVHYEVVTPSPGYAPPPTSVPPVPPVKRRRNAPLSLLIFTTAALLVVSTILIVTVIMNDVGSANKASGTRSPSAKASLPAASPSPSASAAPAVLSGLDKCLIGSWTTTSEIVPLDAKNTLKTTAGPALEFLGDGTMSCDYGSGVTYAGTVTKKKAELLVTGQVTSNFTTVGRTINFNRAMPDVRNVYTLDGVVQANGQSPVSTSRPAMRVTATSSRSVRTRRTR